MNNDIAIIGMAGRFPGAPDADALWRNLCSGKEAICRVTDEELLSSGLDPKDFSGKDFVRAAAFLDGVEWFDAAFFNISPREAEIMDPQHRVFLECAWEALESAGYAGENSERAVSVYAGATINTYLLCNLLQNREVLESLDLVQLNIGNGHDFLATRVSYKLNLKGSSQTIQSACSTSLVAVHHACQSVLREECEMAMAGGVSINLKLRYGYKYVPGGMTSPDGHCRTFDENAQGTVFGSGVGIVVLKKLENALRDGDFIHAVIKGSAVNNDGSFKVGYTSPGIDGQARVIAEALANAGVEPESITYVETHGTGTPLGDPIEIMALTQAFRAGTSKKNFCAVGSIKPNLGHLDAAAGVAGLIKTVLSLRNQCIPPMAHFKRPNPEIGFEDTPFHVNTELREWKSTGCPRRAGVSAFGVGGTNAHVILEEAPQLSARKPGGTGWELLLWSARSKAALDQMTRKLAEYLQESPDPDIGDVAYTLRTGRKTFSHRRFAVCRSAREATETLIKLDGKDSIEQEHQNRPVAFLFPGQGSQIEGMGKQLYQQGGAFRTEMESCAGLLEKESGLNLRNVLYGVESQMNGLNGEAPLQQTWMVQPALFAVEYALARQWIEWGIKPAVMLGHSVGEYVAACLAGVFSKEEGLRLVTARGRLMQKLPPGKMLAVGMEESEAGQLVREGVWLAAVNGPMQCVLSGESMAMEKLKEGLVEDGVNCKWLSTSHAFHSGMMDPILAEFGDELARVNLQAPQTPFLSNVTGTWITAENAKDANYWIRHLRETVRFSDGLKELLRGTQPIFLEVGPGQALTRTAKQQAGRGEFLATLANPLDDPSALLNVLGRLWVAGASINWACSGWGERGWRLPLPCYSFERQRYWIEPEHNSSAMKVPESSRVRQQEIEQREPEKDLWQGHPRPPLKNPYVPPGNQVESTLTRICERALSIAHVGIDDNFFELGGDSLMALQVIADIKKDLGIEVTVTSLYECLTIRSLAEMLNGNQSLQTHYKDLVSDNTQRMELRRLRQQTQRSRKAAAGFSKDAGSLALPE